MKERIKIWIGNKMEKRAREFLAKRGILVLEKSRHDVILNHTARLLRSVSSRDGRAWRHRVTAQAEGLYHLIAKAPR